MIRSTTILLLLCSPVVAEDPAGRAPVEPKSLPAPDQAVAEHKPAIERLDDGRMKIGQITFDPKSREISFPAFINMREGLLEFVLVHEKGKIHESLLYSTISATNLNVAIKLLDYKASRELYHELDPDGSLGSEFETATPEERAGSRMNIEIEWMQDEKPQRVHIREWINHAATERAMPDSPWVYGGSFVAHGRFVAEGSGDLIAIFLSNAALINFSGKDNESDEVWLPHPTRVPEIGTAVTVILSPHQAPASK